MKVYYQGRSPDHTLMVEPAHDEQECSAWRHPDGRPRLFEVKFKNHVANVDDNLAAYLVAKKLASRTKLITP